MTVSKLDWLAAHDEAIDKLIQMHIPTIVNKIRDTMQREAAGMRDRFEAEIKVKSVQHQELNEKCRQLEVGSLSYDGLTQLPRIGSGCLSSKAPSVFMCSKCAHGSSMHQDGWRH